MFTIDGRPEIERELLESDSSLRSFLASGLTQLLSHDRFLTTREQLERFCEQRLTPEDRVTLEATTNTWSSSTNWPRWPTSASRPGC